MAKVPRENLHPQQVGWSDPGDCDLGPPAIAVGSRSGCSRSRPSREASSPARRRAAIAHPLRWLQGRLSPEPSPPDGRRPAARPARRVLIGIDERDEIVLLRQASDDGREREMPIGNVKQNDAARLEPRKIERQRFAREKVHRNRIRAERIEHRHLVRLCSLRE